MAARKDKEENPSTLVGDDASSSICESDDGTKCDSANEDFLSAEDDEPLMTSDEYNVSVGSWESRPSKTTSIASSLRTESLSGSSDALESAACLAKGIRILSYSQEENWRKINDLIEKKDSLIKEMTDLVRTVKLKISSSSLHSSDGESANLCVSCSKPITRFVENPTMDSFWTKNPIDFIEDLFHGDEEWRGVKELYDFDEDGNEGAEWNLGDEENKNHDLLDLDFTKVSVPRGFENSSSQENADAMGYPQH